MLGCAITMMLGPDLAFLGSRPRSLFFFKQKTAYEIALNFNGVPYQILPRAASEVKSLAHYQLLRVNEAEYTRNPCRRLVVRKGKTWTLAGNGERLLDLLTY